MRAPGKLGGEKGKKKRTIVWVRPGEHAGEKGARPVSEVGKKEKKKVYLTFLPFTFLLLAPSDIFYPLLPLLLFSSVLLL